MSSAPVANAEVLGFTILDKKTVSQRRRDKKLVLPTNDISTAEDLIKGQEYKSIYGRPNDHPNRAPTIPPGFKPWNEPTSRPTAVNEKATAAPTGAPVTDLPTTAPSLSPITNQPTETESLIASDSPSMVPTLATPSPTEPSMLPTIPATPDPTPNISQVPSEAPPINIASDAPSAVPTMRQSDPPSSVPTTNLLLDSDPPSNVPTTLPSTPPTLEPLVGIGYPPCPICPDENEFVGYPNREIAALNGDTCATVDRAGQQGAISPEYCPLVQTAVAAYCTCVTTHHPTSAPTEAPSEVPSQLPTIVDGRIPVDGQKSDSPSSVPTTNPASQRSDLPSSVPTMNLILLDDSDPPSTVPTMEPMEWPVHPECPICPDQDNVLGNPKDEIAALKGVTCGEVDQDGRKGFIPPGTCQVIQNFVAPYCTCVPAPTIEAPLDGRIPIDGHVSDAPSAVPTMNPTARQSDPPSNVPSVADTIARGTEVPTQVSMDMAVVLFNVHFVSML